MTDAQKLIAEVTAAHRMSTGMTFYRNGTCKLPTCRCGESMHPNAYPRHLAAAIDTALGGLAQEGSQ